jgi:hypothetical protein
MGCDAVKSERYVPRIWINLLPLFAILQGFLFDYKDGSSIFFRNVGKLPADDTLSHS